MIAGTWTDDGNGHGTHCTGVIGAIGEGVVGICRNPNLFNFHIGKVLSDGGAGLTSSIMKAIACCHDAGAKVINMNLGGGGYAELEDFVYDYLYNKEFLVVAAAGNDGHSDKPYPASDKLVISVAAVDSNMKGASFSQYYSHVELYFSIL